MNGYLPHRYSQKSVDRFIPILEKIVYQGGRDQPESISFYPSDLFINTNTAIARLRDAVAAITRGLVVDPRVSADSLHAMWPKFKITASQNTRTIVLVPRDKPEQPPVNVFSGSVGTYIAVLRTDTPRFEDALNAFAVLLGLRILQGTVAIDGQMSDAQQKHLMETNDIVFQQETPHRTIML